MMKNSVPLMWVEIGRKPSKYLLKSINIHIERFPEIPKYLILNRKYRKLVKNIDVKKVYIEDLTSFEDITNFQSGSKAWSGLQQSYWTNTTARFYAINAALKDLEIQKLIHLESDCILLSTRAVDNLFDSGNWGLKYAKQHENYGCASILLINQQLELDNFLKFISLNWHRVDFTDMNALGEFIKVSDQSEFLYSGNPMDIQQSEIFDGVTIGRFFLGGDARNSRLPFSARGKIEKANGEFDPTNFSLVASDKSVHLTDGVTKIELQNLHMHSKRIPNNWKKLMRTINKDGTRNRNFVWKLGHFDSVIFKERLLSFIQRRILRNKFADPRFR